MNNAFGRIVVLSVALAMVLLAGVVPGGSPAGTAVAQSGTEARGFVGVRPVRVLDTRQPGFKPLVHDQVIRLKVAGLVPVPETAVGVAMNVTVTQPSSAGFLTVWPGKGPRPNTSSVNFEAGESVPNLVNVGVDSNGEIQIHDFLYAETGTTHVIVDVVGYYQGGFSPVVPSRIMDSRVGLNGFKLGPGEVRTLRIQGAGTLPATPIGAVSLNVTAVSPTAAGYLTIWPSGRPMPVASSLNFVPGDVTANAVISGVGNNGSISIFNFSGDTDVLVDVTGSFLGRFTAVTPRRALDTRQPGSLALAPGTSRRVKVTGIGGVPVGGVGAVAMNVTVTQPTRSGFLTIWPSGPRPNSSNLNFVAGQTVPNAVISAVNDQGEVSIHNPFGNSHVLVDITGWFAVSNSAPELRALSLTPGAGSITVEARIIDDVSGNRDTSKIRFTSGGLVAEGAFSASSRISGTALNGVYRVVVPVQPGTWTASVTLEDLVSAPRTLTAAQLQASGFPSSVVVP